MITSDPALSLNAWPWTSYNAH